MADKSLSGNTLADDVLSVVSLACPLQALLDGALSLLEEFEGEDREGKVWSARQFIEIALAKAGDIFATSDNLKVLERVKALEKGRLNHG